MRPHHCRTSPLPINTRITPPKTNNASPLRAYSRQTTLNSKEQRRKQKSLTETKTQTTPNSTRKLSFTSNRYRMATSKSLTKKQVNELQGIITQSTPKKVDMLQEQRQSLRKLQRIRKMMQIDRNEPLIKYRNQSKQKLAAKITPKLKSRPLKGYIEYICGAETEFNIGFDFSYLKNLSRAQANAAIDFSAQGVIQSIELCALDILQKREGSNKLLREYSLLYVRQFQKNMMEAVLYQHYYKTAQHFLLLFYLHCRYYFILLHQLSYNQSIEPHLDPLKQCLQQILHIQRLANQGKEEIDRQSSYVGETLKVLKVANELEKCIMGFVPKVKDLIKRVQREERVREIMKQFEPLEKQGVSSGLQLQLLAQCEIVVGWAFFSIPPIPFLPTPTKPYTLVLSIQNLLVHYNPQKKMIIYRPYLDTFLHKLAPHFEIVAFSTEAKPKADQIINCIERNHRYFTYRLYKEHLSLKKGALAKDLSKLGRENERVLMIDTQCQAPGIWRVPQFQGSSKDRVLLHLTNDVLSCLRVGECDLSKTGGYLGSLQHIEEQLQEDNTISSSQ